MTGETMTHMLLIFYPWLYSHVGNPGALAKMKCLTICLGWSAHVWFFFLFAPMWPQVRQGSPYTSTCRMGQWMRWSPTCHAVHRRTAASWRAPHASAPCCGANSSAGRSTDSSSTSPHTKEEETPCWSSGGLEPLSGRVEKENEGQRNAERKWKSKMLSWRRTKPEGWET